MNIDKEYLDQKFAHIDQKFANIDQKFAHIDQKFANIDQKLEAQTVELKGYVRESFETQQVYLDERFKELIHGMRVKVDFPTLKQQRR